MSETVTSAPSSAEIFGSNRMWGLKELPLPEPVSWWPQTPGWYVLGAVLLLVLLWFGWKRWRRYQHNAYRRNGIELLDAMAFDHAALKDLPFLLRLSALRASQREDIASLRGKPWITWLNHSVGREVFVDSDGAILDRLTYAAAADRPLDEATVQHLIRASKDWMRCHRAAV